MSYSFTVDALSKEEAKNKAREEFRKILVEQPQHQVEHEAGLAAVSAYIDMLNCGDNKNVRVSVQGKLDAKTTPDNIVRAGIFIEATSYLRA